jgi:hypothetical protein
MAIKTISKIKTFIPKFDGNRDEAPENQCVVRYKAATIDLKSQIIATPVAVGEFDSAGKSTGMKVEIKQNDEIAIRKMIVDISHLGYQEEGSDDITYIKGGADLLKAPIEYEPLIKELLEVLNKELKSDGVDQKN